MSHLDPRIEKSLRDAHTALAARGELLTEERLTASYARFRARFGPDVLASTDGVALLNLMHTHGNKDSLVYWLEFKNDDEFPGPSFGSIAGGSAHKFGIFRRKGTEQWVSGSPKSEQTITEDQAVEIARKHRDQLLAGVRLFGDMRLPGSDAEYLQLQSDLEHQAADIVGLAWAHKYWSLLFPDKLDDFHNERWQRYNLLKVLETPPTGEGLYVCAGRFVRLAQEMAWPINQLTAALNERNGQPSRYWRVGTKLNGGEGESIWPPMRDGDYVAIGWDELGDLSPLLEQHQLKESIRARLAEHYPAEANVVSRKAGEIRDFLSMEEGDVVLAADGEQILGLGRVAGPYRYEDTEPVGAPHRRAVAWSAVHTFKLPKHSEGLRTTCFQIRRYPENIIEIERRLLDSDGAPAAPRSVSSVIASGAPVRHVRLQGVSGRLQSILERKGQAILFGPPGTGKTFWARRTAFDIAALSAYGRLYGELDSAEQVAVYGTPDQPLVRWCTFHPSFGYEDFIEGFRPEIGTTGQLVFRRTTGIFKAVCEDARKDKKRSYVLVIDEINRGDIPRIFGELLTLLEKDKRGSHLTLPVSGDQFSVPENVYVLGTMNTADRSIALLDTALRRRFGFVELLPDAAIFGNASAGGSIPLGPWLSALNDRLRNFLGRDARNLQVGHAYLMDNDKPVTDFTRFVQILSDDIVPLLEEYCYEDFGALAKILGSGLVDEAAQKVRSELFVPAKKAELVQALLEPSSEIATAAAISEEATEESEDEGTEAGQETEP